MFQSMRMTEGRGNWGLVRDLLALYPSPCTDLTMSPLRASFSPPWYLITPDVNLPIMNFLPTDFDDEPVLLSHGSSLDDVRNRAALPRLGRKLSHARWCHFWGRDSEGEAGKNYLGLEG